MDDTIIKVKSSAKFAKDENDWVFLYENIIVTLKRYYEDDYSIVIFTNQKGISAGKTKKEHITKKIELIQ